MLVSRFLCKVKSSIQQKYHEDIFLTNTANDVYIAHAPQYVQIQTSGTRCSEVKDYVMLD